MTALHRSPIDYLAQAEAGTGRKGYVLNICTGCKHGCPYCYAREMVEHGRLKEHPAYPYGFAPTFHPERITAIGGRPKLIFANDMGDVGGDWNWKSVAGGMPLTPFQISQYMIQFALLNPQHILLLLTKRPEWYGLADWPKNVWCGRTATNNRELNEMTWVRPAGSNWWISLEPWLDQNPPTIEYSAGWLVIGGLSGKYPRPVSEATMDWLRNPLIQAKRFVKANVFGAGNGYLTNEHAYIIGDLLHQYPDAWKVAE